MILELSQLPWVWKDKTKMFNSRLKEGRPARTCGALKQRWSRLLRGPKQAEESDQLSPSPASPDNQGYNKERNETQVCSSSRNDGAGLT